MLPDGNSNWNGTPMAVIGVSFTSPDTLLRGHRQRHDGRVFEIRRSVNGGATWTNVTAGLPNRYPTDITYDRQDSRNVWLTFSGYGTPHVFRSTDAGLTWSDDRRATCPTSRSSASRSIPSIRTGSTSAPISASTGRSTAALPGWSATRACRIAMVLDLVIRPGERIMRAATFGNGVYEIALAAPAGVGGPMAGPPGFDLGSPQPNPSNGRVVIPYALRQPGPVALAVFDAGGRRVRALVTGERGAGAGEAVWDGLDDNGRAAAPGTYFVRLTAAGRALSTKITRTE